MRFVKIGLRGGKTFSFPEEKVLAILECPDQLIRIYNKHNKWTGKTVNKADISWTEPDNEATHEWNVAHPKEELPEPKYIYQDKIPHHD